LFTGIVAEIGWVTSAPAGKLAIAAQKVLEGIELGGSIAVNGVCLTVVGFDGKSFSVDVMPETLRRTNLGLLKAGDGVNLERPLSLDGELGGHLVQGHIDDTARVTSVISDGEARIIGFEASPQVMRYVVEKGFIAVDGVSLTVAARESHWFQVSVVEYTRKNTTLGGRGIGDLVNLEVDIIAKYVEQLGPARRGGITVDFLQEHGFSVG
jgi:riboflavin synthase